MGLQAFSESIERPSILKRSNKTPEEPGIEEIAMRRSFVADAQRNIKLSFCFFLFF